jgi:hypothetical protein
MIIQVLHCPNCQGTDIVRHGQTRQGRQRYRCREPRCAGRTLRHLDAEQHEVGKTNTQKFESKHINLHTRIKRLIRRTICFAKTERMHDLVIGLCINRYEFGRLF